MNRSQRSLLTLFLLVPLFCALPMGCSSEKATQSVDAAAIVNGIPIPKEDILLTVNNMVNQYKQFGMEFDSTKVDSIRGSILDSFIKTELMFQASKAAGFKLTDEELEKELNAIISQYPSPEMFSSALAKQGISEEKFRSHTATNVTIKNFIEETITNKIEVTPEAKTAYYDEHREDFKHDEEVGAKHILIQTTKDEPEDSVKSKRVRIESILERARNGEDFSALATEYSEGPSSSKGGDLGYFGRGKMVKPFEEAAFALNVGEISDVVETNYGFHIIKVYDKKGAGYSSFEEVEDYIENAIKSGKTRESLDKMIDELTEKADIKILL